MTDQPKVTILIPALNEERDIAGCIEAVAQQDYPHEYIEVIVIDGVSEDDTVSTVLRAAKGYGIDSIRVLSNPRRRTSSSLNVGLLAANGAVIARLDARSRVEPSYLSRVVSSLEAEPGIGVVGGAQIAVPRTGRTIDLGIARALGNRWTTGLSRYRRSMLSGPSDTVWMGVFRTTELRRLGGWADDVALNEDYELNSRYRKAGFTVWFDAGLRSGYLPRPNLSGVARQHFYFGRAKGTLWARGMVLTGRHRLLVTVPIAAGLLAAVVAKRIGSVRTALLFGSGVLLVDARGGTGRAGLDVRMACGATMCATTASWWVGSIVGYIGERMGLRHRHS